jgi:hypothetical protein
MLRLALNNIPAMLNNFNPRAERNGEELRPAGDISLTANLSADDLVYFSPTLKSFLFDPNAPRDLADGSPLRYPALGVQHWAEEMTGAKFELHVGVGAPVTFKDARINKFVIEPVSGGSVRLSFRVQIHPDETQAGRLSGLIQSEVEISLTPAELPVLGDGAGEAAGEPAEAPKRGRRGSKKEEPAAVAA